LVKLDKKNWKLEHKLRSKKHFLLDGALASGLNGKIYITGSKLGKTKAVISVDTKGEVMTEASIERLPELNFGRHSHSMTILSQRYLFVIGGKNSVKSNYQSGVFERLDLQHAKLGWSLIHFSLDGDEMNQFLYHNVAAVPFSSDTLIIFAQHQTEILPHAYQFDQNSRTCTTIALYP
jgi:hypothetical protein